VRVAHERRLRQRGIGDEASFVGWVQESALLPSCEEADRRMRTEGRASQVLRLAIERELPSLISL
jgi:hypothetical protein